MATRSSVTIYISFILTETLGVSGLYHRPGQDLNVNIGITLGRECNDKDKSSRWQAPFSPLKIDYYLCGSWNLVSR
jgi:hypothetical protein